MMDTRQARRYALACRSCLIVLVSLSYVQWALATTYHLPFLPSASDSLRQGFVRIVNHTGQSAGVAITAKDDAGKPFGPISLFLDAYGVVHFNSNDLELGNEDKGIRTGIGGGQGDWRLILDSGLEIEALAYVRTPDGFVTSIHDLVPRDDDPQSFLYYVPIFNPGSNDDQASSLRIVNPGDTDAEVVIQGRDDTGAQSRSSRVSVVLPAGESKTMSAQVLEAGSDEFEGSLGDGSGKWRLFVESSEAVQLMSLLTSPEGHITNLSSQSASERISGIPLFLSTSIPTREGFARIVNRVGNKGGQVPIAAIDDIGRSFGSVAVQIDPDEVLHFTSSDLEQGNSSNGILNGIGVGQGDWRLLFEHESSDFDHDEIEFLSYARTTDGFLTSLHDLAQQTETANSHYIPIFNPGSNERQVSWLRLTNTDAADATIAIKGWDDSGKPAPGEALRFVLPAGETRSFNARTLEEGAEEFEGSLGDGFGKWRLFVEADRNIHAMSLLAGPEGHITNLSTATASMVSAPRVSAAPCIGGAPDGDDDGLADDCDQEPRTAYRTLSSCSDGSYVNDPDANSTLVGECKVLVAIANAWEQDPDFSNDQLVHEWGSSQFRAIEDWKGVRVRNGRIIGLSLDRAVKGSIPPELGRLVNLTHLDLSSNGLTGPIPPELGQLVNLKNLLLGWNLLSGPLPPELGLLVELVHLNLAFSQLEGPIPPELGKLTKLTTLTLTGNRLSGSIPPEFGQLVSLERLLLIRNRLSGPIPSELGQMVALRDLYLNDNRLTGPIPSELGQMVALRDLYLNDNRLTGSIPAALGQLPNLQLLDVSDNKLTGSIPPELGRLANLHTMDLANNQLTGTLPPDLGQLAQLNSLNFSNNQLTGRVPSQIWQLTNVGLWGVDGNRFTGNAAHHSVSYYQAPLVWEWNWQDEPVQHQRLVAGRWMAIAVRIDHDVGAPQVNTRVVDRRGDTVASQLSVVGSPKTQLAPANGWRTEYVLELPGDLNQPGYRLIHEIDPEDDLQETQESDNVGEPIELNGEEPPQFRVSFIPLHAPGNQPPVVMSSSIMKVTGALWPIADNYRVWVRAPRQVDAEDTNELLNEVRALWNAEAEQGEFYHGIFESPWPGSVSSDEGGVADRGGYVAVSRHRPRTTVAHQFGHNLDLRHAPGCGADDVDVNFPYPDGGIGPHRGWDKLHRNFVSNGIDIMSYCSGQFVSDYHYEKAAAFWIGKQSGRRLAPPHLQQIVPESFRKSGHAKLHAWVEREETVAPAYKTKSVPLARSLAVSGYIDALGRWYLTHEGTAHRGPRSPAPDGPFTLLLKDESNAELYREPLSAQLLSHGAGAGAGWAARIPIPARAARRVVILDAQGRAVLEETLSSSDTGVSSMHRLPTGEK